jgi:porin
VRTSLSNAGLTFGLNYIGETFGNLTGGLSRGAIYEGRLEMLAEADLEKLLGWTGAIFHVNAYQIHGRGLTTDHIGNLLTVSNIEAHPSTPDRYPQFSSLAMR